jgi:hypothetical protein
MWSAHAGERDNAARAAEQMRRQLGLTWAAMLEPQVITVEVPSPPPPPAAPPPKPTPEATPNAATRTAAPPVAADPVVFWLISIGMLLVLFSLGR